VDPVATWILGIVPVVVALVAGYMAIKKDRPAQQASGSDSLIARLIETGNINTLRIDKLEAHGRIKDQFIFVLIKHINDGLGPPAPNYPEELLK
jgi:hypothetical protein